MAPGPGAAAAAAQKGESEEVTLENECATLHVWLKGAACPTHHHHHHHHNAHANGGGAHHHTGGPRFSFVSKTNPELGIFDTSLVEFNGNVRGKPWRASLAKAAVRVEETGGFGRGSGMKLRRRPVRILQNYSPCPQRHNHRYRFRSSRGGAVRGPAGIRPQGADPRHGAARGRRGLY